MTVGEQRLCGAWRRDADPCDAPAGLGTCHPGWGRCRDHYGDSRQNCARAAQLEALSQAELVAERMGFPIEFDAPEALRGVVRVYTRLVTDLRVLGGAMAYCDLRLAGGFAEEWVAASAALAKKWGVACRRAKRAGVVGRDGHEITMAALKHHLPELQTTRGPRLSTHAVSVDERARLVVDAALRHLDPTQTGGSS